MLRRRGWLLAITTIAGAACAYAVGAVRRAESPAEAGGVVSADAQLTPDQANRLAITYAGLIPNDEAIAVTAARALGTTPAEVSRRLSVFNDLNTALLRIDYRATTRE